MKNLGRASLVVGASLLLGMTGWAQDNGTSASVNAPGMAKVPSADKQFMQKAAQGGMAEVELGQLAQQNAQSAEVKAFGQRMVTDHSKANDQLKQLASQQGVALPTGLNAKDKATKAELSNLKGAAFDKAYMKDMLKDHREDIAEFKKEASSGQDPELKQWADQTLPVLNSHLREAEKVAPTVGVQATAMNSTQDMNASAQSH